MSDEQLDRKQRLLAAARGDSPPKGARERVLAAMGVSAGASLAGAKAAALPKTATLQSAAGGTSAVLKAIGLGAVAGAVGMAAVVGWNREAPPKPRVSASVASKATPSVVIEEAPRPSASALIPAPPPAPPRIVTAPPVVASLSAVPEPSAPAPLLALAEVEEQRALIESARQSLATGRASTAIKALNKYEARFGFGILGHEQVALKVRALMALGRRAEGTALGERYLAERPNGTQAVTIRRLLGEVTPSDQN